MIRKTLILYYYFSVYNFQTRLEEDTNCVLNDDPNVEKIGPALRGKEAIRIRDIRKTYTSLFGSTNVEAVKGISLDIYDGQVTAILGK